MSGRALTPLILALAILAGCSGRGAGRPGALGARDPSPPLGVSDSDALRPTPSPGTAGGVLPVPPDGPNPPNEPPTDGGSRGGGGGAAVPEPGTILLVGTGLAGAALARRRRRKPVEPQS